MDGAPSRAVTIVVVRNSTRETLIRFFSAREENRAALAAS
jgi:hypothetical protein